MWRCRGRFCQLELSTGRHSFIPVACSALGLILVSPKHLAGFRIDQVQPRANRAGDGLINVAFAFGRIVSDPALHVQTRIRAAVDEGRHPHTVGQISYRVLA
jgi:hypothetical protein